MNGTQVPVDMDSCIADISDYVQLGENTIQVRVTSSLRNRMIEQQYSGWMGEMQPDNYGMTGDVVLQTYTKVATVNKGILNSVIAYAESAKASSEDVYKRQIIILVFSVIESKIFYRLIS